ncbi:40S ribosomal protein S25 [Caenorhabditis elegans]|uniref:40S ribosomal protein S25 n=1 Tax=Caenorhabditis elegans TaxID=6239 RepID=Q14V30_CAEEL|nr:40S ribosomal protein S25 [Caenorhabditis elegans]pir/T21252/ hypothetical protein F22D6.8 - Caenorhabditis elegans [Caenorhabditis elegans]CAA95807.1 40S ribosomal protein S25 [Caenorhabditis elegans]|eukprot:NP_001040651.1 Uncharacterized protein CELE_F22D6.8 [Caenorhabditis elegans]
MYKIVNNDQNKRLVIAKSNDCSMLAEKKKLPISDSKDAPKRGRKAKAKPEDGYEAHEPRDVKYFLSLVFTTKMIQMLIDLKFIVPSTVPSKKIVKSYLLN